MFSLRSCPAPRSTSISTPTTGSILVALVVVPLFLHLLLETGPARAAAPKYYFRVNAIESVGDVAPEVQAAARELLEKELAGRPELTTGLAATSRDDLLAQLAAHKLEGFDVNLKLERVKEELRDPRPGGRLKQLAVEVKLSVLGTTIREAKMAFSGEGEAGIAAEITDRRRAEEGLALVKEALGQAVKQAVDQAIAKLSRPKSVPVNETKRRRRK